MTVKISRISNLSLEYIGKVAEVVELQIPSSFFMQRHYLKVEVAQSKYMFFHINERVEGHVPLEPVPIWALGGGW